MSDPYEPPDHVYGMMDDGNPHRILNIKLGSASHLLKKDIFGLSDPYVKVSLCSGTPTEVDINDEVVGIPATTRHIKKTLHPVWNQIFKFRVNPGGGPPQYLLFEVFDFNKVTQDDFLGMYRFHLFQLPVNNSPNRSEDVIHTMPVHDMLLKPRSRRSRVRGRLHCQFTYDYSQQFSRSLSAQEIDNDLAEDGQWESVQSLEQDMQPLPQGWEERVDFSGRIVYVDHVNRSVTLDRPALPAAPIGRHGTIERQHSNFDERRQISEDTLDEVDDILEATILEQTIRNSAPSEPSAPLPDSEQPATSSASAPEESGSSVGTGVGASRAAENEEISLPAGWESSVDFSGRTVYVNHVTRTAQFEPPVTADRSSEDSDVDLGFEHLTFEDAASSPPPPATQPPSQPPSHRFSTSQPVPTSLNLTETDGAGSSSRSQVEAPESPLPAGWSSGKDPSSGRTFYIDHNSRSTSWNKPKKRSDGLSAALGPLPAGWEMRDTQNGRPFFINHRTKETSWHDPRQDDPLPDGWEMRVHADGRVFYVDHTTKSTQWEDPRKTKISSGPAIQYSRDYKVKYENFKANLPKPENPGGKVDIKVKRTNILEDSYNSVMAKSTVDLMRRLWITFDGEPGLDYGGVAREWFYALSREMFNPYYGLWEYSAIDNYTLQINPNSGLCNPEHEQFFHFFGRVCGMAVYHGKLVDGFFIRPFYKLILGKKITLEDMAEVDTETYNSLKWIIDNDPEDLCLAFTASEDKFGQLVETPLVTNGENIDVTNFNKAGYVTAYINWKFVDRIASQVKSFKKGINDVIPLSKLAVFDENELEYLMCGITQIDVEDWKTYTDFKGGYSASHHVVVWFWKAVFSFDNEFRARLLQFVTGTSRVPMNGFRELQGSNGPQKFCIEKWGSPGDLPRAHTCFNRIDLPPYNDYHTLREKLRVAVECTGGFDID